MTANQAVETAKQYLVELFPETADQIVRLEEIESPERAGAWGVTLSITDPKPSTDQNLASILGLNRKQIKLVELDHDSGALIAVKNKAA